MNLVTASPALVVVYVGLLMWILMDLHVAALRTSEKVWVPLAAIVLAVGNHLLRVHLGAAVYAPLIFLTLHLPFFFLFLRLSRCSAGKMAFMIFSAVVFTAPTVHISNIVRSVFESNSAMAMLLSNLLTYALMLLLAQFVFRRSFNHFVKYADGRIVALFSLLPLLYFIYMFASMNMDFSAFTSVRGHLVRLMPTILVLASYFLMMNVYHELQEKRRLDVEALALRESLDAAEAQMARLKESAHQTAVYHHDMRHHLTMIDGLLSADKAEQASEYIRRIQEDISTIDLRRYCENEAMNLLCSSFAEKAASMGVQLTMEVSLPKELSLSDTELCSMVSNGLENALHAVGSLDKNRRWVQVSCRIRNSNLLLEIKNPYRGTVRMQEGVPLSGRENHGYGCHSIQTIAQRNRGHCLFEPKDGVFTLRVALPL